MIHGQGIGCDCLTTTERAELEPLAGRRRTAHGLARRAQIVLAAANGVENKVIAPGWVKRMRMR